MNAKAKIVIASLAFIVIAWLIAAIVFFGSGGKLYYPATLHMTCSITIFADEPAAKAMDALRCSFPIDSNMCTFLGENPFSGQKSRHAPEMIQVEAENDPTVDTRCMMLVNPGILLEGNCRHAFPNSGKTYIHFSERELLDKLTAELKKHVPSDAVFQVRPIPNLFGDGKKKQALLVTHEK